MESIFNHRFTPMNTDQGIYDMRFTRRGERAAEHLPADAGLPIPTGGGKTALFTDIIRRVFPRRALVKRIVRN